MDTNITSVIVDEFITLLKNTMIEIKSTMLIINIIIVFLLLSYFISGMIYFNNLPDFFSEAAIDNQIVTKNDDFTSQDIKEDEDKDISTDTQKCIACNCIFKDKH